jgi:hypothetical protein
MASGRITYELTAKGYKVVRDGKEYGFVWYTGTKWAAQKMDGTSIGTAKTRKVLALSLICR